MFLSILKSWISYSGIAFSHKSLNILAGDCSNNQCQIGSVDYAFNHPWNSINNVWIWNSTPHYMNGAYCFGYGGYISRHYGFAERGHRPAL